MKNCKWTAGPWSMRQPNGDGNGYYVGPAWLGLKTHTDECKANAHLIAAAPELYDALDNLVTVCLNADNNQFSNSIESALAALSKARGETE